MQVSLFWPDVAFAAMWEQIRADAKAVGRGSASAIADMPLWSNSRPPWAEKAWADFRTALPDDENWEVWIDWYEDRLRGGSRGEAYELVFASVPLEVWEKGPAAANAWIKVHLPKGQETEARPVELPEPLPDLDSPFAYGWNTRLRVEVVAGAQSLPFYSFFSSEEDHRQTLEACRVAAERLLKDLREGSYSNAVRREYAKKLEYYLHDLPKTAGVGNILLAYDQIAVLRAMLAQDDAVSFPFATDLGRLIQKQSSIRVRLISSFGLLRRWRH